MHDVVWGFAKILDDAHLGHHPEDIIGDINFPPEEALIGAGLVVVVVVMPPLTKRKQRKPPAILAVVCGVITSFSNNMSQ